MNTRCTDGPELSTACWLPGQHLILVYQLFTLCWDIIEQGHNGFHRGQTQNYRLPDNVVSLKMNAWSSEANQYRHQTLKKNKKLEIDAGAGFIFLCKRFNCAFRLSGHRASHADPHFFPSKSRPQHPIAPALNLCIWPFLTWGLFLVAASSLFLVIKALQLGQFIITHSYPSLFDAYSKSDKPQPRK